MQQYWRKCEMIDKYWYGKWLDNEKNGKWLTTIDDNRNEWVISKNIGNVE